MAITDAILALFAALPLGSLLLLILVYRAHQRTPVATLVVIGNFLVLIFLVGTVLLAGELRYRFAYDQTDGLGVTLATKRWMQRHYQRNNLGYRDNMDYAMEITPHTPRISIIGDSFTAANGVPDIEDRFANILRRAFPEWEIHGIAWGGANPGSLTTALRQLVSNGYELDKVLYVYMTNDVDDLISELRAAIAKVGVNEPGILIRHSYLLNSLYYRFRVTHNKDMIDYFDLLEQGYTSDIWQLQRTRLEELATLVRESGGDLLVVTFPFFETVDSDSWASIHHTLSAHWETAGIPHLDLRSTFAGLPVRKLKVNRFDSHPSRYAHRLAAAAIQDFLSQQLSSEPLVSRASTTPIHTP